MKQDKEKKKVKVGKLMTTIIILVFAVIGICLIFGKAPIERMTAYKMLLGAIFPYLLPVLGGVAIKGIVSGVTQNRPRSNLSGEDPEEELDGPQG